MIFFVRVSKVDTSIYNLVALYSKMCCSYSIILVQLINMNQFTNLASELICQEEIWECHL